MNEDVVKDMDIPMRLSGLSYARNFVKVECKKKKMSMWRGYD